MPHVTQWKTQSHDSAWQYYRKANVNRMVTYKILFFLSLFTTALQFIIIQSETHEWFPGANGLPSMRCKNRLKWKSSGWHGSILKSAVLMVAERKEEGEEEEGSCEMLSIFHLRKSRKQKKERERICVRCSVTKEVVKDWQFILEAIDFTYSWKMKYRAFSEDPGGPLLRITSQPV